MIIWIYCNITFKREPLQKLGSCKLFLPAVEMDRKKKKQYERGRGFFAHFQTGWEKSVSRLLLAVIRKENMLGNQSISFGLLWRSWFWLHASVGGFGCVEINISKWKITSSYERSFPPERMNVKWNLEIFLKYFLWVAAIYKWAQ